jgi:hypothetical protein
VAWGDFNGRALNYSFQRDLILRAQTTSPVQEHYAEPVVPLISEIEPFGVPLNQSDYDGEESGREFNSYECSYAGTNTAQDGGEFFLGGHAKTIWAEAHSQPRLLSP